MNDYVSTYPNRTLCDVLEEMRKCNETRNYAYLLSLIEEVQSLGNKMEAALHDKSDYKSMSKALDKLKKEYKPLRDKVKDLEEQKEELEKKIEQLKEDMDVNGPTK